VENFDASHLRRAVDQGYDKQAEQISSAASVSDWSSGMPVMFLLFDFCEPR
jgi:hypothetical protein